MTDQARALANEIDQLFRQKHTMADVEHLLTKALAAVRRETWEAAIEMARPVDETLASVMEHCKEAL